MADEMHTESYAMGGNFIFGVCSVWVRTIFRFGSTLKDTCSGFSPAKSNCVCSKQQFRVVKHDKQVDKQTVR